MSVKPPCAGDFIAYSVQDVIDHFGPNDPRVAAAEEAFRWGIKAIQWGDPRWTCGSCGRSNDAVVQMCDCAKGPFDPSLAA